MNKNVQTLINEAVINILKRTNNDKKINKLKKTHEEKIHFIPFKYRVFGGLLQSMNIQFGNFIEELMTLLIDNENDYEVIRKYSGKRSNKFALSKSNDSRIDKYISNCQINYNLDLKMEFTNLLNDIVNDSDSNTSTFKHDIDVLFRNKNTNVYYYLECKYNDDHDTGKFTDINRKFIKTYAYLAREFNVKNPNQIVPILFFFTNKRMKGNIYLPEDTNIKRGKQFFDEFLSLEYSTVDQYLTNLSESSENISRFDELYKTIMQL